MKLIIAIVQDEDASRLVSSLMNDGYGVTKLATTGGFLRAGNTTLLIGVDDDRFQGAMSIIEKVCKSRKQIATSPSPVAGTASVYVPYPIEVMVGGATVFVLEVEQFIKL
ncbi:MAG TPA: cyclic-di-AMP receptor [Candidatus Onthenecus intestinigallinarum]|uniref:Cyclic-di-AMP receptor n=1 Tax=Candidatus Onthenecus intestinigallinarum TaxID=2840875 RepID=A0A9D0ZCS2_9FIRM|nr:cyclic-di-AMP receptor [Candidatus Onthenecus intestinigallinarum]